MKQIWKHLREKFDRLLRRWRQLDPADGFYDPSDLLKVFRRPSARRLWMRPVHRAVSGVLGGSMDMNQVFVRTLLSVKENIPPAGLSDAEWLVSLGFRASRKQLGSPMHPAVTLCYIQAVTRQRIMSRAIMADQFFYIRFIFTPRIRDASAALKALVEVPNELFSASAN